jgi:hypothetical protein
MVKAASNLIPLYMSDNVPKTVTLAFSDNITDVYPIRKRSFKEGENEVTNLESLLSQLSH